MLTHKQIQLRSSTLRRVVTDAKNRVDVLKQSSQGTLTLSEIHLLKTALDALKIAESQLLEVELVARKG